MDSNTVEIINLSPLIDFTVFKGLSILKVLSPAKPWIFAPPEVFSIKKETQEITTTKKSRIYYPKMKSIIT